MEFALKDIRPNPFRHLERYPINKAKVAALKESMQTTGFWDNLVARVVEGSPEIAYGHHRMVALKELFGPTHKIPLIVRDLDNETMLKIMARENMEEWGANVCVEHETLRAVVEAYANGDINIPYPKLTKIRAETRLAPSFIMIHELTTRPSAETVNKMKPYDSQSISDFIGWNEPNGEAGRRVREGLNALQYIEEGILAEDDFAGLTSLQARSVLAETRKARRSAESPAEILQRRVHETKNNLKRGLIKTEEGIAKAEIVLAERNVEVEKIRDAAKVSATKVGKAVSQAIKEGKVGYRGAEDLAFKHRTKAEKPPMWIDDFAMKLGRGMSRVLDKNDPMTKKIDAMIQFRDQLNPITKKDLLAELNGLSDRVEKLHLRLSERGK